MPPKRRDLGPGEDSGKISLLKNLPDFELKTHCLENEHGQVGCLICKEAHSSPSLTWILRPSWKKHLQSPFHLHSVALHASNRQKAEETSQQYSALYSTAPISLQNPLSESVQMPPPLPNLQERPDEDCNGVHIGDFDFDFEDQQRLFPTTDSIAVNPEAQVELLRREIELLHLAALDEEFEGADDETIPRMADIFRDLGKHLVPP